MTRFVRGLRRHYTAAVVGYDAVAWIVAAVVAALLRYPRPTDIPWPSLLVLGVGCALTYVVLGLTVRLHQGRARTASFEEFLLIGSIAGVVGALGFVAALGFQAAGVTGGMSRAVPIIATLAFLTLAVGGRTLWRHLKERDLKRRSGGGTPVLLVGAGDAAQSLIRSMQRDADAAWDPVGLVDDDPRKTHLHLEGVPVLGTVGQLAEKVRASQAAAVILADPGADRAEVAEIGRAAETAGVPLKTVPTTAEMLSDGVGIRDLRDINLTDVLGRNQLDTDIAAIAGYITGRRVLVTGAGGSIGSELCRQIRRFAPDELMMLDRDESALHTVSLSLHGRALLDGSDVILADIRDPAALTRIFTTRRPEVVFHAAALKHLPMLEQYPVEAVKTNVLGTRNVLDAALAAGTRRVVNISTDKAANPISVLGYSKRIAERLTSSYAGRDAHATFLSVRFGNVLGSRGSVLTAFADQIANGGPVTVTDARMTRFFMTIQEACQLVIQAGAIGDPGEALVLDMGEPVGILGVAEQLIERSGRRIDIEFTGLRHGEKVHEELFGDDEPTHVRPRHPLVFHVPVPGVDEDEIAALPTLGSPESVIAALAALCEDATTVRATRGAEVDAGIR